MPENLAQVITKPNGSKEYRVSDHLASLRVAIEGATTRTMDNDPWGNPLSGSATGERSTFNDQERDAETGLFDLSDRNLDPAIGAFSKPDRLMEKFRSVSPYNYCFANPVRLTDPDGMQAGSIHFGEKFWPGVAGGGAGLGVFKLVQMAVDAMKGDAPVWTYTTGSQGEPIGVIDNRPLLNPPPPIIIIPGPRALLNPPPPIILHSDGKAGKHAEAPPAPTNGETEHTKRGREEHNKYNPGPTYDTKFILPSGLRPDAVDLENKIVRELKPDNPRAIKQGLKQVEKYRKELEKLFPGNWKAFVDTYKK